MSYGLPSINFYEICSLAIYVAEIQFGAKKKKVAIWPSMKEYFYSESSWANRKSYSRKLLFEHIHKLSKINIFFDAIPAFLCNLFAFKLKGFFYCFAFYFKHQRMMEIRKNFFKVKQIPSDKLFCFVFLKKRRSLPSRYLFLRVKKFALLVRSMPRK